MRVVDAAVDDCDAHTVAACAERLRCRRADVRHGFSEVEFVVGDADDARDRSVRGQRRQIGCVDVEHDGVQRELQRGDHVRGGASSTPRAR